MRHTQFSTQDFASQDLIQGLSGQATFNLNYLRPHLILRFVRALVSIPADSVLITDCTIKLAILK